MKRYVNPLIIILCIGSVVIGFLISSNEVYKTLGGICIGIGAGGLAYLLSIISQKHYEQKYPKQAKLSKIEYEDERGCMIRMRAKSRSSDIIQWLLIGFVFLLIITNAPLWQTLLLVGIYLLKTILDFCFMIKYQKEF